MKRVAMVLTVLAAFGCAKLNIETAKPIKVDINMRVDVYQHMAKEANSITDQIYGDDAKKVSWSFFIENAYAESMDDSIDDRKERIMIVQEYLAKGYVGEDRNGLLQIRPQVSSEIAEQIAGLVKEENEDRENIYQATAIKHKADLEETRKVFSQNQYKRAPAGSWFEVKDAEGKYVWVQK